MKYHFIGIGGTGMGALAGLLKSAGHDVRGSDRAIYSPMKEQLQALKVPVFAEYSGENLGWGPDVVVAGNTCKPGHPEIEAALAAGLTVTSLPAVLSECFLADSHPVVVAGTHGKTTTTALVAHVLLSAGKDPSFLIGGVPVGLPAGWRCGSGEHFVIEGDEYSSAFDDPRSKFLHYRPRTAILTSIELDHVDIFASMDAVRETFQKFVASIPEDGLLVVARAPETLAVVGSSAQCRVQVYDVPGDDDASPPPQDGQVFWSARDLVYTNKGRMQFTVTRNGEVFGQFESLLVGRHNAANIVAAAAVCHELGVDATTIRQAMSHFAGVKRRQEIRGLAHGVFVMDDYAHHPTAVRETLLAMRQRFPGRTLHAVFEPRTASSRRRVFEREFVTALSHADHLVIGPLYQPQTIPEDERLDPDKLAQAVHQQGTRATYIEDIDDIAKHVAGEARPGDVVVVLSSGAFGGVHDKLLAAIGDPVLPATAEELPTVRELLREVELQFDDVDEDKIAQFLVLRNEKGLVGCVALEVYGEEAILRSLAVTKTARSVGYGWMLADTVIAIARHRGVKRMYLLTETASDFFAEKLGFRSVVTSTVSREVMNSSSFASCADNATAMRLDL